MNPVMSPKPTIGIFSFDEIFDRDITHYYDAHGVTYTMSTGRMGTEDTKYVQAKAAVQVVYFSEHAYHLDRFHQLPMLVHTFLAHLALDSNKHLVVYLPAFVSNALIEEDTSSAQESTAARVDLLSFLHGLKESNIVLAQNKEDLYILSANLIKLIEEKISLHASTLAVQQKIERLKQQIVSEEKFRKKDTVFHRKFGAGLVIALEGSGEDARINVNFQNHGSKWLALRVASLELLARG